MVIVTVIPTTATPATTMPPLSFRSFDYMFRPFTSAGYGVGVPMDATAEEQAKWVNTNLRQLQKTKRKTGKD